MFLIGCFFLLQPEAKAQTPNPTAPQEMPISIARPKPPGQKGLKRPVGDGNLWTFRIVPEPGLIWVEGPNWSYPGKGAGADPDWGQWGGGDGELWLSWISPQKAAPFVVKMTGKVGKPGGHGGAPIDVEASWEGEVQKKVWKPEPAIDPKSGVMVAPQNQQFSPYTPIPVIVGAGQPVLCAVTDALDKDTWTLGEESGEEADTIKYEWTTSGGGFVTSQHPDGTAPKAETQNANWKAPSEPGEYSLSCRIDDTPKEIPEDEDGDRDDEPAVVREVEVEVLGGESSATLKLYKDAELTEEVTGGGAVGGTAYAVLELKIGAQQRLTSSSATIRIEEQYPQHSEEERQLDIAADFTQTDWQKKTSESGEWADTIESPTTANGGTEAVWYRKNWSWNTATSPLGHNETHTLAVTAVDGQEASELKFAPVDVGDEYSSGPSGISADVKNLVITDIEGSGNPDYIKFDPTPEAAASLRNPKIKFTIEDEGDHATDGVEHDYEYWVFVYKTTESGNGVYGSSIFATIKGVASAGEDVEVAVNEPALLQGLGTDSWQSAALTEWGTYAFDISVLERRAASPSILDSIPEIRSQLISIPPNMPGGMDEDGNPRPGHDLQGWSTLNDDFKYYASLYLASQRDASDVRIDFVNPLSEVVAQMTGSDKSQLLSANTPNLDLEFYIPKENDEAGEYRGVFSVADSWGEVYREHENRRMLAVNKKEYRPKARDFAAITSPDGISWPARMQKNVGFQVETNSAKFTNSQLWNAMPGSRVFFTWTHGDEPTGGTLVVSAGNSGVYGKPAPNDGTNISRVYISSHQPGALTNMRVVFYMGCKTGQTDTYNGHGNLLHETVAKGAAAAGGFTDDIPEEASRACYALFIDFENGTQSISQRRER